MPVLPVLIERNPPVALLGAIDEIPIRVRGGQPVNRAIQPTLDMLHLVREVESTSHASATARLRGFALPTHLEPLFPYVLARDSMMYAEDALPTPSETKTGRLTHGRALPV